MTWPLPANSTYQDASRVGGDTTCGPVLAAPGSCLRIRLGHRACSRCRDACPHDAVTLSVPVVEPVIDSARCTGCGQCVVECPIEALRQRLPTRPGAKACEEADGPPPPPRIHRLVCRKTEDRSFPTRTPQPGTTTIVSCLLGLPPAYVGTFAPPKERLQLWRGNCETCEDYDRGSGGGPDDGEAAGARALTRLRLVASFIEGIELIEPDLSSPAHQTRAEDEVEGSPHSPEIPSWATSSVDRKTLLVTVGGVLAAALAPRFLRRLIPAAEVPPEIPPPNPWSRAEFIETLVGTPQMTRMEGTLLGIGSLLAADAANCDGCGLCARSCPTRALTLDAELYIEPSLCTSCGACILRCAQKVLLPAELITSADLKAGRPLFEVPSTRCACGATLEKDETSCVSCLRATKLLAGLTGSRASV